MMSTEMVIAGRALGPCHPPFVIAELSANHGSSLERALRLLEVAKECGVEAVKLQTYTADTMTIDHKSPDFFIKGGLWNGRYLYDLYREAHTPFEWHGTLFARARELGLIIFSTPFDASAVELLESLDAPAYKIASFELVDLPLIARVAATGRPVIMSTGMARRVEIAEAVATFRRAGGRDLMLLHCVSGYPTPAEQSNLRRIPALADEFQCLVGLSDHTSGVQVAIAATALGACAIEKHFTLRRSDGGPDAAFSLEPPELSALVSGVRTAFSSLGDGAETRSAVEIDNLAFRRSLYVVRDMAAGDTFSGDNLRIIRPGFGLPPKYFEAVIGRRATRALSRGTALTADAVEGSLA
jgi:pseudaminic acid synthase